MFGEGRKEGREGGRNQSLHGPLSHISDLTLAKTLSEDEGSATEFVWPSKNEASLIQKLLRLSRWQQQSIKPNARLCATAQVAYL